MTKLTSDMSVPDIDLDQVSARDFELLKLTLDVSYSDARERLNSAERIAESAIRGMLLLNAGGIATIVTVLGFKGDTVAGQIADRPTFFALAVLCLIIGVGSAASAGAAYSKSTYRRSDHELAVAENLLKRVAPWLAGGLDEHKPLEDYQRRWRQAQFALVLSFAAFAAGSALAVAALLAGTVGNQELPDGRSYTQNMDSASGVRQLSALDHDISGRPS